MTQEIKTKIDEYNKIAIDSVFFNSNKNSDCLYTPGEFIEAIAAFDRLEAVNNIFSICEVEHE